MQISICPSNPRYRFFYQRHKTPWGYWHDQMLLSIRNPKSQLSTWYVFVFSRLLLGWSRNRITFFTSLVFTHTLSPHMINS